MNFRTLLYRAGLGRGGSRVLFAGSATAFGGRLTDALGSTGSFTLDPTDADSIVDELTDSDDVHAVVSVHEPPAFDGLTVVTQLREMVPDLPIVVVAADAEPSLGTNATVTTGDD